MRAPYSHRLVCPFHSSIFLDRSSIPQTSFDHSILSFALLMYAGTFRSEAISFTSVQCHIGLTDCQLIEPIERIEHLGV